METPQDSPRWQGLKLRVASALPLVAVVLLCVYEGGMIFFALVIAAALLMIKEWEGITANQAAWFKWIGYPAVILPCACLAWLRTHPTPEMGLYLVIYLIATIAATDIGAYFIGKRYGKHKLVPVISPNKTWEGLGGGVACAVVVTVLALPSPLVFSLSQRIVLGLVIALLAQAGDIGESWLKRNAGVKDSGSIIPGHGGLLDRVDGYLLTVPMFALLTSIIL